MEKKSLERQSLFVKRATLKKIYSCLLVLVPHAEGMELDRLIQEAGLLFRKYDIEMPKPEFDGKVYDFSKYRDDRENN